MVHPDDERYTNCGQRSDFAYKQKAIKIIADEHVEKNLEQEL